MSTENSTSIEPETPGKINAATLTVPKRPQPAQPDDETVAPAATSPTDPGKGGEGGERGLPPLPPSNAAFLAAVIRDLPEGAAAAVCSVPGDPNDNTNWNALAVDDLDRQCPADNNNYLNCSSFLLNEAGNVTARKDRVGAFHLLVLDDVGTKIDRDKLEGVTPTWEIETSLGNSQVGFRLLTPLRDLADVKALQDSVTVAELSDPGANGAARWVRLPYAINGKVKHRLEGRPFACHLLQWNPDVAYSVEELVKVLGVKLGAAPRASVGAPRSSERGNGDAGASDVYKPAPVENPVLTALRSGKLFKRTIAPGKHDITCPWADEHTDGLDSGSAYFEPDAEHPIGGYKCQHSHGEHYRIHELLDFLGLKADAARGKARIDVVPGEMNRVRRAAEVALTLRGGYYQAGGAIVVIRSDPSTGDITTDLLGEPALASALSDAADWYRYDGRTKASIRTDPPTKNVLSLLRSEQFDHLPPLSGLARQPFFREGDGVLVSTPGYDFESGRYAAYDATKFVLPEPTEQAARDALAKMSALLDEFRFASPEDRSATLCAMLTAAVRPSLPVAPAFNITASSPGSGKSYLASTVVPFAGPGAAFKVSYPTNAEEASKTMLSTFLSAPAVVVFDDMQTQWLPFGAINRALTSDTITDRLLGTNRTATAGTRSLIMGTGNNIGPVRDMTRRVVTIRLHHKTATPALTRYDGNPAELVAKHRGEYVSAALTIIAAYRRAGSPITDVPSIASYGGWSELCRQPLLWLGLPDPASSLIDQLAHDPDQDLLGRFLATWHDAVGDKPVTLRALMQESDESEHLSDAMLELPVVDRDSVNRSKLGWYLKNNANRVVGGLELQRVDNPNRTSWRVVAVESDPAVTD
jgi:hypothetical protein